MDSRTLHAEPRTVLGKKVKTLRRTGITPIHLYGPGGPPLALQAESVALRTTVVHAGRTSPVSIVLDGESDATLSFIKDVASHPVSGEIQHVDFIRVQRDRVVEAPVDVRLVGDSPATVGGQAVVTQILRSMVLRALPFKVPSQIDADVSVLEHIGAVLRVRDLDLPEGVELAGHPEDVIARIEKQREAEVFADQVGAGAPEEVAEGEEAAAAEEAPAEAEGSEQPDDQQS